jgi:hypothetical protein
MFKLLQPMKMLFFSADQSEVQEVSREFVQAGILCEVRRGRPRSGVVPETELWIRNDADCHRAFLLCVQLGMGFARRPIETIAAEYES